MKVFVTLFAVFVAVCANPKPDLVDSLFGGPSGTLSGLSNGATAGQGGVAGLGLDASGIQILSGNQKTDASTTINSSNSFRDFTSALFFTWEGYPLRTVEGSYLAKQNTGYLKVGPYSGNQAYYYVVGDRFYLLYANGKVADINGRIGSGYVNSYGGISYLAY